jgi:hypothetical protein
MEGIKERVFLMVYCMPTATRVFKEQQLMLIWFPERHPDSPPEDHPPSFILDTQVLDQLGCPPAGRIRNYSFFL